MNYLPLVRPVATRLQLRNEICQQCPTGQKRFAIQSKTCWRCNTLIDRNRVDFKEVHRTLVRFGYYGEAWDLLRVMKYGYAYWQHSNPEVEKLLRLRGCPPWYFAPAERPGHPGYLVYHIEGWRYPQ